MSYIIKEGDNLSSIAKKNGITLDLLLKLNPNIKNVNEITPGLTINLKNIEISNYNPQTGLYESNNESDNEFIKLLKSITNHKLLGYTNTGNSIKQDLANGNFKKALYDFIGGIIDDLTVIPTAIGLRIAPSYSMPLTKDIPITMVNRFGRFITGDKKYTLVKGHVYNNDDYSNDVVSVGKDVLNLAKSGNNVRSYLNKRIKKDVDPNLEYGNSKLLKYPFNPTAGYAWTIGGVTPYENQTEYYTYDPFDNDNNKTQYYLNKSNKNFTDYVRGIGGLFTSHSDEPIEGKQITRLSFKK